MEENINSNYDNIELKVANDKNFKPIIENKFQKKKYKEFIDLMKRCWNHSPIERPTFNEIILILQEYYENF
jgi:hypothetical protein